MLWVHDEGSVCLFGGMRSRKELGRHGEALRCAAAPMTPCAGMGAPCELLDVMGSSALSAVPRVKRKIPASNFSRLQNWEHEVRGNRIFEFSFPSLCNADGITLSSWCQPPCYQELWHTLGPTCLASAGQSVGDGMSSGLERGLRGHMTEEGAGRHFGEAAANSFETEINQSHPTSR